MVKRPVTAKMIERYVARVSKKRDELRALTAEFAPLVESMEEAEGQFDEAVRLLEAAKAEFENAVDTLSQFA